MNNRLTAQERRHVAKVKEMNCGVCDQAGPSDAHHIKQHNQYLVIPLCRDCHMGYNGIHGTKAVWGTKNITELDVLNETIKRLIHGTGRDGW